MPQHITFFTPQYAWACIGPFQYTFQDVVVRRTSLYGDTPVDAKQNTFRFIRGKRTFFTWFLHIFWRVFAQARKCIFTCFFRIFLFFLCFDTYCTRISVLCLSLRTVILQDIARGCKHIRLACSGCYVRPWSSPAFKKGCVQNSRRSRTVMFWAGESAAAGTLTINKWAATKVCFSACGACGSHSTFKRCLGKIRDVCVCVCLAETAFRH